MKNKNEHFEPTTGQMIIGFLSKIKWGDIAFYLVISIVFISVISLIWVSVYDTINAPTEQEKRAERFEAYYQCVINHPELGTEGCILFVLVED